MKGVTRAGRPIFARVSCGSMSMKGKRKLGWLEILTRAGSRSSRGEPSCVEEWEAQLVDLGVSGDWAARLAARLLCQHAELGRGSASGLLQGAAIAVEVQAEVQADVERNLRDVREVERLLGAFSGELEKLDEVLEVLSAYAQRMRAKPSKPPPRILH